MVEPLVLLLILVNTVTLVVQSAQSVYSHPRPARYFGDVTDYILLAIFGCYTFELLARIIVSGLLINPPPLFAAPIPVAAAGKPKDQDVKEAVPILTEHRRQMSRSNTLNTLGMLATTSNRKRKGCLPEKKVSLSHLLHHNDRLPAFFIPTMLHIPASIRTALDTLRSRSDTLVAN